MVFILGGYNEFTLGGCNEFTLQPPPNGRGGIVDNDILYFGDHRRASDRGRLRQTVRAGMEGRRADVLRSRYERGGLDRSGREVPSRGGRRSKSYGVQERRQPNAR